MGKPTRFEVLQAISGHYLTDYYPDNWETMNDDSQTEFMNENVWEPFENWDTNDVASEIEAVTDTVFRFVNQVRRMDS